MLESYEYGYEIGTSCGECHAIARRCLARYWHCEGGRVQPLGKVKPRPEMVRVVAKGGTEICRWTKDDALRMTALTGRLALNGS